ncbi:MAG TPA: hypothetical protein VES42_05945 [Pilimelia sp.]|nr:hypothetical protein [Pilimelia sp.]
MGSPRVFLAWSGQVDGAAALNKALDIVKTSLLARDYEVYDWNEQPHNRNINHEVEERLRDTDMLILEGSTERPNPAFEMGFARYPDLPIIVLKQEDSRELPADYGSPKYLLYPKDVGQEAKFVQLREELDLLLNRLERESFSGGHRALRRSLSGFVADLLNMSNHYSGDHPHLYLIHGLVNALTADLRSGGPSVIAADSDYYVQMFGALQERTDMRFRAIADLTDSTEAWWEMEHPEPLSNPGSERIFLVDWRLFFEREAELAALIDSFNEHLMTNPHYRIFLATDSDLDPHLRHPLGRDAVGRHLLLVQPGNAFGGYRSRPNRDGGRLFVMETDAYRYGNAEKYYASVQSRAIELKQGQDFLDIKRLWLETHQIGAWSRNWTHQTERRNRRYFARYDQHVRCWIPSYNQLISECAAMVAREILRVREHTNRSVKLLEIGYGTGSLTAQVGPWITRLSEPFANFGHLPPVEYYHAVDRADQMRMLARAELSKGNIGGEVTLLRQVAWKDVRADFTYDVIFGSLITHFMIERTPAGSAERFFAECAVRLSPHGSLVFADSFGLGPEGDTDEVRQEWRSWMVEEGLPEVHADSFLDGNRDMLEAHSVHELVEVAKRHGFELSEWRLPTASQIFAVVSFRRVAE